MSEGKMKLLFVAGPYNSPCDDTKFQNIVEARDVAKILWSTGFAVFCPHCNSLLMGDSTEETEKIFYAGTLEILGRCDAIVMMRAWAWSDGAKNERVKARELKLPIFYWNLPNVLDDLEVWRDSGVYVENKVAAKA